MNHHKISGLANPTQNNDAIQKLYVDERVDNLHQQSENLQARVARLERLSLRESTEPAELAEPAEPTEPAEAVEPVEMAGS